MRALVIGGTQFMGRALYFGEMLDLPPLTSSVAKIERVLDFGPIGLEEGLRQGFAWYLEQPRREVDYSFEDRLIEAAR